MLTTITARFGLLALIVRIGPLASSDGSPKRGKNTHESVRIQLMNSKCSRVVEGKKVSQSKYSISKASGKFQYSRVCALSE